MYDTYGKEGLFASAYGGGWGPGGQGRNVPGQGGGPNFFFSGSPSGGPGGGGGSTFFSFGGGDGPTAAQGSGTSFGGFTDPRELFEGLFGGTGAPEGGGGMGRGQGGGVSSLFGSLFGSPSFDDLPGMHGMGRGGEWGGAERGRSSGSRRKRTGPPVEKEFWCSLRELYQGCEKKMKVRYSILEKIWGRETETASIDVDRLPQLAVCSIHVS